MTWIYTWWYGEEKKDTLTLIWEYATPYIVISILFLIFVGYEMLKYLYDLLFGSKEPQQQSHEEPQQYRLESAIPCEQRPNNIFQPSVSDEKTYYFDGREVYVASTIEKCRPLIQKLKQHLEQYGKVLAIDCEWNTDHRRRPVALLQLASYTGFCILIRLNKLKIIFPELKEILEDSSIVKVGVSPCHDAKHLRDDYGVHVKSRIDLRFMADAAGLPAGGLAKMAQDHLGVELDKSYRFSDWEAEALSEEEIYYAAEDVLVAIRLFKQFSRRILRLPLVSPNQPCKEHMYITLLTRSLQRADHMAEIPDLRYCTCPIPIDVDKIISKYCSFFIDINYGPKRSMEIVNEHFQQFRR